MDDMQRSSGEPEAVRRQDGGGETAPLPGSEAARDNAQPSNHGAGHGEPPEEWTPGTANRGIRPGSSPAEAAATGSGAGAGGGGGPEDYDSDPQGGGGAMPHPKSEPHPATGADAPSHGSR